MKENCSSAIDASLKTPVVKRRTEGTSVDVSWE